jgi:hypoxanthine-DNA glycosylase
MNRARRSVGFLPVATVDARMLILGSLPGPMSLQKQQYYAQPRNAFWLIMGELFGASPDLAYGKRLATLKASRIALWDVCHSAERAGALDADIRHESVVANDFVAFFRKHPRIQCIFFNGQTAAALYRKLVLTELPESLQQIPREVLPSTSPAHAAMRVAQKLERWSVLRRDADD